MKKFKTTWILAGVLLVLAAYVYWGEVKGSKKREAQKEKEEKVLVFEKGKVESVTLLSSQGKFQAKRSGEKEWILESPLKVPADKLAWNNIVDSIYDLKFNRVISEKSEDLVPYGLKDAKVKVEMTIAGEKEKKVVYLGDENPVGDSLFATVGNSQKVILVPQTISSVFDKGLKDLREKKLFTFDQDKAQEIEVSEAKGKKLVLKKEKEKWFIASSAKKEEADSGKVSEILNTLNFLEVSNFIEEDPKDLAKYELKNPQLKVTLRDDKKAQLQLLIGKKENNGIYISKAAEKPVYQVNTYILDRISTDTTKLIKKEEKKEQVAVPHDHAHDKK
ncbi:MAG: DUF4340 domain-containing protein [Deltaproteobacteria bacterium]|nr:DUF4340 domain-containing protein [Deltaproteobacteria bacterium]